MARSPRYEQNQTTPYRMSRSAVERYIRCPRCFVLEVKHGVKPPQGVPFTLNVAVDGQLKKEFDVHRANQTVPDIVAQAGLKLVPFNHPEMDTWRHNFTGVKASTPDFDLYGAVDDIWVNEEGELVVVDYKATGNKTAKTELPVGGFYDSYRRQMDFYQWLLRQNGFQVSNTGYFLYATATQKDDSFDGVLTFECNLIAYEGDASWIEGTLTEIKQVLDNYELPSASHDCDNCRYAIQRAAALEELEEIDELPEICTTCKQPMSRAVYGMTAGPLPKGFVGMGCIMMGNGMDPRWVCESCSSEGDEED